MVAPDKNAQFCWLNIIPRKTFRFENKAAAPDEAIIRLTEVFSQASHEMRSSAAVAEMQQFSWKRQ